MLLRKVQNNLGNYNPVSFYSVSTKLVETIITKSTKNHLAICDTDEKKPTGIWRGLKKKSFFTSPLKYSEHINAIVNARERGDIHQGFLVPFNKFPH